MMSKFIIVFAVITTVVRSSFAADITSFYDLSEDQSVVFSQFREDQNLVNTERFAAFDPFFDILNNLAEKLIKGETVESENTVSLVPTSEYHALVAVSIVGKSYVLASGKICLSIETPTKYTWYLTSILSGLARATELAGSGNYDDNGAEIEELRLNAHDDNDNLVQAIFDYLRGCLDTTDTGTLSMLQESQDQCNDAFRRTIDAVFNGAETILIAKSADTNDDDLLSAIAGHQNEARAGLEDLSIGEYALFLALYLQTVNDLTGLGPELFSIEYTWLVSYANYTKATEIISDTIEELMNGTNAVDTATAQVETSTHYEKGTNVLVESVMEIDSDATTATVSAFVEYFDTYANESSASFYAAMALTQSGSTTSEIQEKIEAMKEEGLAEIPTFVTNIVELIRNGKTWGEDVEAEMTTTVEEMTTYVRSYVETVYSAIQQLNSGDLDEIDAFQSEADSAAYGFTYQMSNLRYMKLRADN